MLGRIRVMNVAVGEAIRITNFERVLAAVTNQHEERMRRIILSSVACPALPYFSTLSHKRHDCRKKKLLNTKSVLSFSVTFV